MVVIVIAIIVPVIIISMVCHEVAHGYAAHLFGDDTAKDLGRLSLNPMNHIHWFGSVVLPAVCLLFGLPVFAMAKPVPIDFRKLFNNKRAMFNVAIAGVVVNILLALVFGIVFRMLGGFEANGAIAELIALFSVFMVQVNVVLAVFNLFPIPPLDGSRLISMWLPWENAIKLERLSLLFILIIFMSLPYLPIIKIVMTLSSFVLGAPLQ